MQDNVHRRSHETPSDLGTTLTFHLVNWDDRPSIVTQLVPAGMHPPMLYQCGNHPHCHEYGELVLVLQGAITHVTQFCEQHLQQGMMAFVHPDLVHSFRPIEDEVCELLNFAFPAHHVAELGAFLSDPAGLNDYSGNACKTMTLHPSERDSLAQRFLWFHAHEHTKDPTTVGLLRGMLAEVFCKQFATPAITPKPKLPIWMESLLTSFQQPDNVVEGLPSLKRLAPCSQGYLCKSFKKHLGKSPTKYINEQRSYMAAQLLATDDTKIRVIANAVGCQSEAHFYSIFQTTYGCTPNEYRKGLLQ